MATKISDGEAGSSVRGKLNYMIPVNTAAIMNPAAIVLDDKETYFDEYTQIGTLTITAPTNNYGTGAAFTVKIATDGSAISYPAGWLALNDEYADDSDNYQLTAAYNGVDWVYAIVKLT